MPLMNAGKSGAMAGGGGLPMLFLTSGAAYLSTDKGYSATDMGVTYPSGSSSVGRNGVLINNDTYIWTVYGSSKTYAVVLAPPYSSINTYLIDASHASVGFLCAKGSRILFCGYDNTTTRMFYSDDKGQTWSTGTAPVTGDTFPIASNASVFAMVKTGYGSQSIIYTSPDGVTWTNRSLPWTKTAGRVISDGTYIAVNNGTDLLTAVSNTAGTTYSSGGNFPSSSYTDSAMQATKPGILTFPNCPSSGVFSFAYSTNNGASYSQGGTISGPINSLAATMDVIDGVWRYCSAGDSTIYLSDDAGVPSTWRSLTLATGSYRGFQLGH